MHTPMHTRFMPDAYPDADPMHTRKSSMDMRVLPLNIKVLLESSPLKSRVSVRRFGGRMSQLIDES